MQGYNMNQLEQRLENTPLDTRARNYKILAETPFAIAQTQFCGCSLHATMVVVAILAFIIIASPCLICSAVLFATYTTGLGPPAYNITNVEVKTNHGVTTKTIVVPIPYQPSGTYNVVGVLMLVCGASVSAVIVVTVVGGFLDKPSLFLYWFKSELAIALGVPPIKFVGGLYLVSLLKSFIPLILVPVMFICDSIIHAFMKVMVGKLAAVNRNNRFKRCTDVSTI